MEILVYILAAEIARLHEEIAELNRRHLALQQEYHVSRARCECQQWDEIITEKTDVS